MVMQFLYGSITLNWHIANQDTAYSAIFLYHELDWLIVEVSEYLDTRVDSEHIVIKYGT